ncbi:alpha/beta hydrolase [Brevibacillus reuszeri]|uniref:Alpha/beta hydrolase n=1 Tax=Brevibacillus reuszeri TaxID=54915 RepID=A0A0K9YXC1_9BACL|nr:DUF4269 domain-containing protein [Brevibacillus reuszeri]KNB72875.1 HIT family protein [Brevibacillus reuszeri]MED1861765.1 DUF4269 domain-containing protein [Brevibacillus reuszeri]GED72777.1 alpha/beta hydrolase [Brevibacillus reuszeri]
MRNWHDITYLRKGTLRQQQAWQAISETRIMEILCAYTPVLAGTIPLHIDVADSDLDIICECHDFDHFESIVRPIFGKHQEYTELRLTVNQVSTSVISFFAKGFFFELFAQPVPVIRQNAYRHMDMEARLLSLGGEDAYREIRRLKEKGTKTEPAFARYFQIPGDDPYQALLDLEELSDLELIARFSKEKTS